MSRSFPHITPFFRQRDWQIFPFQEKTWEAYLQGKSGILNAPTGSGKTYAMLGGPVEEAVRAAHKPEKKEESRVKGGLQVLWITPMRALAREINDSAGRFLDECGTGWRTGVRTGDTSPSERTRQKASMPQFLVITPESLHILFASPDYEKLFKELRLVVVDEWHELLGSKRGVQTELALSRLKAIQPKLRLWGISATIGNLDEAMEVLLGPDRDRRRSVLIRSRMKKPMEIIPLLPDETGGLPWAGHLGIRMIKKVLPVIHQSRSTLIFTNTRNQAELWYRELLEEDPSLAGSIAMHHGSIDRELRQWVEDELGKGRLKAVVATSSLDLGVDFKPVETVIQVGGPKGVARFAQRAGRSGHSPGALSRIYFLPTHSLELIESAALRHAVSHQNLEARIPYLRSFDVLLQYMLTLAVGGGFDPERLYAEVKTCFAYQDISRDEFDELTGYILHGGKSLSAYDEYRKAIMENGRVRVKDRRTAIRHRLSIGTIVGDTVMQVKFTGGKRIGTIEEGFVSQLKPGDVFWFAGRSLELVRIREMQVQVRLAAEKKGKVPQWMGGRMPLSSNLGASLREKLREAAAGPSPDRELQHLEPLLERQKKVSHIPSDREFLIESFRSREGHHLFFYPFEGRFVNEALASLVSWHLSEKYPVSFSIAMNDYGFELLGNREIDLRELEDPELFSERDLLMRLQKTLNITEIARRKFRDIAAIGGLVFKGYPGKIKKDRHLQASGSLLFEVFRDYEPDNLLYRQAYEEAFDFQVEEVRLRQCLSMINASERIIKETETPSPFAFPIMVDMIRSRVSSEKLEDRIRKMQVKYDKQIRV